jgi:hypothetical protein
MRFTWPGSASQRAPHSHAWPWEGVIVRAFNDLAVPGLGGVWFAKQLFLATLGVAIAERVRDSGRTVRNIEVANAVEALACWLALDGNGWKRNPRLRGASKMRNKTDLSFQRAQTILLRHAADASGDGTTHARSGAGGVGRRTVQCLQLRTTWERFHRSGVRRTPPLQ